MSERRKKWAVASRQRLRGLLTPKIPRFAQILFIFSEFFGKLVSEKAGSSKDEQTKGGQTIRLKSELRRGVDVTFDNLKIDVSGKAEVDGSGDGSTRESNAAVTVKGGHDATIELDGDNELKSGSHSGHEEDPHTGAAGIGDGASRKGEIVPDASSRAGGMIPPSRPRQALAGYRQAETAIRPVNPAALGAGTRDAETDLRTITKNHR